MIRKTWISKVNGVAVSRQCILAGVSRATIYARQKPRSINESDLLLCRLIDEEYTRHPFYCSRKMVVFLKRAGHLVNRKRLQRLMRQMGLAGMAPGPNSSRPHPDHKIYPYLLRGVSVNRPNQVQSTGITYIRAGPWFYLPGGDHRLVLTAGDQLADQQQYGSGVLRRLPGGSFAH